MSSLASFVFIDPFVADTPWCGNIYFSRPAYSPITRPGQVARVCPAWFALDFHLL
jgi:hypothetical protein